MRAEEGSRDELVRLAFLCAWTFRATDYRGGCNGARLRFPPASGWPLNGGAGRALELLARVKASGGPGLSWADLIALAGTHAVAGAGAGPVRFCGGRTDAADGEGLAGLEPRISAATTSIALFKDFWLVMGLTPRETVALSQASPARLRGLGQLSADYFRSLVNEEWAELLPGKYTTTSGALNATAAELIFKWDPEYLAIVFDYIGDPDLLPGDFSAAWERLMNADLFGFDSKHCTTVAQAQLRR